MNRRSAIATPHRSAARQGPAAVRRRAATAAMALLLAAGGARAGCVDEDRFDATRQPAQASSATAEAPADPRADLRGMVREALERSNAVGAARMLADAAQDDTAEIRAARLMQASMTGSLGPSLANSAGTSETNLVQARAGFNLSQLLYDGGRNDRLVDWRTQLAESARYGQLNLQEQVALTTVSLALERSRFRMQAQVYGQYVRKMGCLVQALEQIVEADKGRLSELVQVKKSLQQAELSQTQAASQTRQIELRLRRLAGDGLPGVNGLAALLLQVPDLGELQAEALHSNEIAQLDAQAQAMRQLARSVEASQKPQLSWTVGGSANLGTTAAGRGAALTAGLSVNIPLLNPGAQSATGAAQKRAKAAELQRAEALDVRRYRNAEVHEQTLSSFDRARRVGSVLRDSERVRNFTLQQWQQLGRRSLFDVMAAEGDHYNLRVAHVNALHDGQQLNAILLSLGRGVSEWLR